MIKSALRRKIAHARKENDSNFLEGAKKGARN